MRSQAGAIGEEGVLRTFHRLATGPENLIEGKPGVGRRERCRRKVNVFERAGERKAFGGERGDDRRELGDGIDPFVESSFDRFRATSRCGAVVVISVGPAQRL